MRLLPLLSVVAAAAVVVAAPSASPQQRFPARIALPNGFQPEGIAIAGGRFFVGSIPTGAVYRGNLRTGRGRVLVAGAQGRAAIGVDVDRGRIFVAGGSTGRAFVYDAGSGAALAEFQLATGNTFVNDVVVTRDAAWFTDSQRAVLYRVALGPGRRPGNQSAVTTVPLTGDFQLAPGFNVNGIDATPNGRVLVIVQSNTGRLFRVDASTGVARLIDLGGATVPNGDGVLLDGRRLYVVRNRDNVIAKIQLRENLRAGRIVAEIRSRRFDVPTTVDEHGRFVYVVNARFGTPATPSTPYWLTRVRK